MLGAIFGDIAGSVYEFNNIKTTEFDLLGSGTTFTDDSILTIAVAYWLLDGSLSKERLAFTLSYFVKKYPSPMGSYGSRFLKWAHGDISKPYNSWGNGSAMRVAPVGWAFDTLEETEKIAALTAEVTHNHPEGIKGAQATAAAIYMARSLATKAEIKQYIESKYGYNLSRTCHEIRPTYQFNESCQETVPQAIIAFLDSVDFESAIRLAVSLGGDSDTLACITGGIAEAFYGMEFSLPEITESNHTKVCFSDKALKKLPNDLSKIVNEFYEKFVNKNKCFWGKNESATILETKNWKKVDIDDKILDEESYQSFLKSYGPDSDMKFGVYYEDGWNYIYRSHFLLKKFRFIKQNDGLYHISDYYDSEKVVEYDVLEDILWYGYFQKPFRYKKRNR
ncbi:MAG: ADP-ribosylglycohydrolase family protein [Paludibacter sp.]